MGQPVKIARVDIVDFEPRYAGGGYVMSTGLDTQLHNRLLRLTSDDGVVGIGEIVHPPIYDPVQVAALEDTYLPALCGIDLSDLPAVLVKWRSVGKTFQGFVFGVELAMLDLIGRAMSMPVSALLGGGLVQDMPEYLSLSCEGPEVMAETVRQKAKGFTTIQAKLGDGDIDLDLKRVRAVLAAMRPDQQLLADFNGALTPDDAIRFLPHVLDPRVMWEEPCSDYDENVQVAHAIQSPVMFDQCLTDLRTYARALRDGAAAALVIKSDSIGGLTVGRTVRDMCVAAGIKLRIDGWWAGQIAGAGALHLATGAPSNTLIATIDLTDPLDTDRTLISHPRKGRVAPVLGSGIGPIPAELATCFE